MNKIKLVEAHERVKNFKADFDAFHDEIENSLPLKEQLQIVEEHDIYNKSKQYLKDIEFLKSQNEKPKTKGLLGAFGFSQPVTVEKVQNVVGVIENIQIRNSRAEANRKRKEEAERTAQAQARREEAERSKKEQSEISEFQNKVTNLAKNAGYSNDFFSEKFRFYSFYTNTYDIFSELGAVQKSDKQAYSKLVIERYEKIQDAFTEERAHTHRGHCPSKQTFKDLYTLIHADKKVAQSFDTTMFERIIKIEKSVKNYENFLYNQEHSASPKSTLEHSRAPAKNLDHDNQFKL